MSVFKLNLQVPNVSVKVEDGWIVLEAKPADTYERAAASNAAKNLAVAIVV